MDGRSNKGQDLTKAPAECLVKTNKSLPRGLLYRELGFKQRQNNVAKEFQQAAEDSLVLKNHEELPCELPDVSRSTFLMVFSPDGTKVASTHGNHNVYVTDLNTGKNVNTLSGHPRTPWCIAFHPSSNQILASGCLGGQVRVWDLHGGSEIWTAESQTVIASLAFHPTDRMLVIATYNELHFWDWSQPIPFTKCYTSNEKEKVRYVAFDPLGHKLITGISNAPHNQSQWDRVATPSRQGSNLASSSHSSAPRSNSMMPPEQERRITVCYRSLVEQYEQLVQRYYDLSRSRTTPTMDRGTDPMELSESSPSNSRSGATGSQPQSQTANLQSRMNLSHDNGNNSSSTGSSGNSADGSGNADSSPRPDSNDRSVRNIPSVVLMNSFFMRRVGREGVSNSESCNDNRSNDHRQPSSLPRRSSNVGSERRGSFQEPNEQNADNDSTSTSQMPGMQRPYFTVDYVRRDLDEGGRGTTENATRDTNGPPPSSHQRFWFSRLHSQAQPSSSSPPERPPRFFISQRSAFQPRVPRGHAEQTHSQPRGNARTASPAVQNSRRYFLQQRLAGSYFSPNVRDDVQGEDSTHNESLPHPGLDNTSDMGVRYGIQLLSRHIDNMQRLCRARLEILQLQQIRRMWEDLQRQIRSLHVAVRESTVALTDAQVPGNRSRRRRLYTHPREDSGLELNSDIPLRRSSRSGESENSSEQGASHIPRVSQMLELARISDIGPSSDSNQTPVTSNNTSEQTNNSRGHSSSQDAARKETLAKLRAQITALAKFKFVVDKTKKEGECSRSNVGEASGNASAVGDANLDSTSDIRLQNSNEEPSTSQSASLDSDREPVVGSSSQSTDVPAQILVSNRTVESTSYNNVLKTESMRDGHSDQTEESDEPSLPSKKKRLEELSSKTPEPHSSSDSSFTVQEAIGSSSQTSTIPTILTTTNTTTTTTTMSSSSGVTPQYNRDQESDNNWNRYSVSQSSTASQPATTQAANFTNSPPSNPSSPYHRLLRISRRVYLRRPRLLALGPRSRRMTGQMSSSSSHRNFSPNIFRHHDCGRRPWFMQSAASRNQNNRAPIQSVSTAAQVDASDTADTIENSEKTESNDAVNQSNNVTARASLSSSDPSPDVSASDQSLSPSEETSQQSVKRSDPSTSSQSDAQTGSSRCQKEKTAFVSHDASSHSEQRADSAPHGRKRKTENPAAATSSGTSRNTDNSQTQSGTQREQTTSESLRAMIARLESLVRQQREQREAARQERSQEEPTRRWSFRTYMWMDENSGSDSDSNTESDARQSMRLLAAEERVISAIQNHLNSGFASRSRRQRSGPVDDDWEWTRESTRLRARQVLSLMVESLTQFFEENGLSNSTSHAVLDEQIYNLYILLQLALELTDLLLAQLVSTRRELEHQWIHHVRSPVALYEPDPAAPEWRLEDRHFQSRRRGGRTPSGNGGGSNVTSRERVLDEGSFQTRRRVRSPTRVGDYYSAADEFFQRRGRPLSREERESHRFHTRPLVPDRSDFFRLSTYRRLLRYRHSPFYDSVMSHYLQYSNTGSASRNSSNLGVNRGENTRRLGPRAIVNCYSRHGNFGAGGRVGRGNNNRPLIRGAISRRDGTGVRLPFSRDGGLRIPALRLPGGVHLPTFEEHNSGSTSGRSPHIMVRVQNPTSASSGSTNQSNNNSEHHQETPQEQQQQQQTPPPPPQQQQQQATTRQQDAFTVPLVRVNDVLIPDTSLLNQPQPRQRPQSPPPHPSPHLRNPFIQLQQERQQHQQQQQPNQPPPPLRYLGNPPNDMWRYPVNPGEASWRSGWRPRFLHPRYMATNPFNDDNDEPLIGSTLENINFIRDSFIITDAPMSPNHRIQAWDFSRLNIPDISNAEKNVIVAECKIHNDASVDVSSDGRLLVTLLPTGRLSSTAMLGVYSLEWESLGQCLYTTSFEQNAVSVSLSPASRHLLVGLASRRVALLPSDRHTMAQIFRLEGGVPGRTVGARGRLCHLRDIEQDREQGYMSLNCIRWAPGPGQGLVYGTNTGKLRILR